MAATFLIAISFVVSASAWADGDAPLYARDRSGKASLDDHAPLRLDSDRVRMLADAQVKQDAAPSSEASCRRLPPQQADLYRLLEAYLVPAGSSDTGAHWVHHPTVPDSLFTWDPESGGWDDIGSHIIGKFHERIVFGLFGPLIGPAWLVIDDPGGMYDLPAVLACHGFSYEEHGDGKQLFRRYTSAATKPILYLSAQRKIAICVGNSADLDGCAFENFRTLFSMVKDFPIPLSSPRLPEDECKPLRWKSGDLRATSLARALNREVAGGHPDPLTGKDIYVANIDSRSDGSHDVIVAMNGDNVHFCGTQGCSFFVFLRNGKKWKEVFYEVISRNKEDIRVTKRFHNGMPVLCHQFVDGWQPMIFIHIEQGYVVKGSAD
jgi:hypothetical protein